MVDVEEKNAVDKLLQAEENANNIIKEAQREREKRLKEAKMSADQEIALFRKTEEERFKAYIKENFGDVDNSDDNSELDPKTKEEINNIHVDYKNNKEKVLDMLLGRIVTVEIEIPEVLKENFKEYFNNN